MSKRLQVVLDDEELSRIKALAVQQHMTLSEWVRQALREARRRIPVEKAEKKISVIHTASRNAFPTGEIQQMLAEIEKGYTQF